MDFEVDRHDLHHTRVVEDAPSPLRTGQARLAIDHFALTSNNVTYGAFGDALQYWNFFPASESGADGTEWGRVPVWGYANVVESNCEVGVGQRMYGYLPMSDELIVEPGRLDDRGFTDLVAHRRPMASAYNRYTYPDREPGYDADREAHRMVLFPLFFTSFLIDDFIADNECFGAAVAVISSASSKTAIGAARLLAQRPGLRVVGLTSESNRDFVASLGCYDETLDYASLESLPDGVAIYVDVAGNADVRASVHERYGSDLVHSMIVGGTHWDHESQSSAPTMGANPTFFFAPSQIAKRTKEWGQAGMDLRLGAAWDAYSLWTDSWMRFERRNGPTGITQTWKDLVTATIDPAVGFVCRPSDRELRA
jgi:Protein of unknown function (DUF2855)